MQRRLNILNCNAVHHGETNGREWTLYEVVAVTESGEPVDFKLRSFEDLPLGVGDYDVTPKDYKGETQYTLKLAGQAPANPGARLGPKVDELREQLAALESRVAALEGGAPVDAKPEYGRDNLTKPSNALFGNDAGATTF